MAVNYASKYSQNVDERFSTGSLTNGIVNGEFDWIGVSTVNVYSIPTSAMNDYSLSGTNRYGTPEELGNETQEMTLKQDRSFTFTIDRKNYDDTMMVMEAGRALRRQIDEVVIPEVDTYRISTLVAGAPVANVKTLATATIKKVAKIAKGIGLAWEGDWQSFVDTPHFYLPKWGSTATLLRAIYGTPSKFKKTWSKAFNRDKGLLLWKATVKLTGSYLHIPNKAKVEVLFVSSKSWYAKV